MADKFSFDKYFYEPQRVEDIKDSAYVVLDSSVLLSAYQWKEVTLTEVLEVMRELSNDGRLKVPSHVFKEFIDQRPKKILEIIQRIDKDLHSRLHKPPKLESLVPFLDMLEGSDDYYHAERSYLEAYDSYRKKTSDLSNRVKSFLQSDPVLSMLKEIIQDSFFDLPEEVYRNIDSEAKEKANKKIPPLTGGDAGKKENAFGDFIIWKHILHLGREVIFVSADKKDDWVLKDHHGNILSPRRELVEEFYEINNEKTFTILSPKEFVALYKPNVSRRVSFDLEFDKRRRVELFDELSKVFNEHDPSGLYSLTDEIDEYRPEIEPLIEKMPGYQTKEEIAGLIKKIFDDKLSEFGKPSERYYDIAEEVLLVKQKYQIN